MNKKYTFFEKDCIREFASFEDALDYYEQHDHDYYECLFDEYNLQHDYDGLNLISATVKAIDDLNNSTF